MSCKRILTDAIVSADWETRANFIGGVQVFPHLRAGDEGASASILTVLFSPGACTAWHTHDEGQYLEAIAGTGWVEVRDQPIVALRAGDRVWCPPGVAHRHGASGDGTWAQLSITPGSTDWIPDDDRV